MMDAAPEVPVTLANIFWLLGIGAAIATTSVGATWALLKQQIDALRDELTTYKGAKDWKLPDTLKLLNEASTSLQLQMSERREFEQLQKANSQLAEEIKATTSKLQGFEARVSELEKALALAQTTVTDFQLSEGETRMLVKPHLIIGVNSISPLNTVSVVVGGWATSA